MDYDYPLSLTGGKSRPEIITQMHTVLDEGRFQHCLRVEQTARGLAERFNEDIDRAGLAGLLHDYAKQIPVTKYRDVIEHEGFDQELLQYGRGVWHGLVGVWFIKKDLGITDAKILQAIANHTTGAPNMTALDEIIFVADFIEPARDLDAEAKARKAAQTSLQEATMIELENTLTYLIADRKLVFPKTILTYNAFV